MQQDENCAGAKERQAMKMLIDGEMKELTHKDFVRLKGIFSKLQQTGAFLPKTKSSADRSEAGTARIHEYTQGEKL